MSKDYGKMTQQVNQLIGPPRAGARNRGTSHKFKLLTQEVAEIPVGAVVEVLALNPDQLAFGDLVCLLKNERPRIGRFLRLAGPHLVVARQGSFERLSPADVLGRVVRAQHQGRDFNPAQLNIWSSLLNRLTDFGTFAFVRARGQGLG